MNKIRALYKLLREILLCTLRQTALIFKQVKIKHSQNILNSGTNFVKYNIISYLSSLSTSHCRIVSPSPLHPLTQTYNHPLTKSQPPHLS